MRRKKKNCAAKRTFSKFAKKKYPARKLARAKLNQRQPQFPPSSFDFRNKSTLRPLKM